MSYDYGSRVEAVSPGLRRRTSAMSFDDEESVHASPRSSITGASVPSPFRSHHSNQNNTTTTSFPMGRVLQFLILLGLLFMVYDRHDKVQEATERLERYREEETALIGQMDRIEDRAAELREKLKLLRNEHDEREANMAGNNGADLTKAQTEKVQDEIVEWKKQYFQVNKDIHALQDFIQDGARKNLHERFGEDSTVRVTIDVVGFASEIVVDLFDEAPHSSWVFLQQLEEGDWDGAAFNWHPSHMVSASRATTELRKPKPSSTKLEFIEKNFHHHEAWTVGLTTSGEGYNLYVNLQDNSHVHEEDVCFGKVVSGFDSLRKLMDMETVALQPGGEKLYLDPPVVIKSMTPSAIKKTRRYV